MGRTSLLGHLLQLIERSCNGDDDPTIELLHGGGGGDIDPMSEIMADSASVPRASVGIRTKSRARYYGNRARNHIVTVKMPVQCPEENPLCTEYRQVSLHIVDRRTIWLAIDDVDWAIRYLFVQHQLRGVALVADDDEGPTTAVADDDEGSTMAIADDDEGPTMDIADKDQFALTDGILALEDT